MKKTIAMLVLMLMLISMTACGETPAENGESQTPGIQNGDQGQSGDDVVPPHRTGNHPAPGACEAVVRRRIGDYVFNRRSPG